MNDFEPLFQYIGKNIENKLDLKGLFDFMGENISLRF